MARTEAYRQLVVARAGGVCEYCRLVEAATGVVFHVEHCRPRSLGGLTALSNLALSCPGCNLAKARRTTALDEIGIEQPLFNPREYEPWILGWHLHFLLDRQSGLILPRSNVGQATIRALDFNGANRIFARQLQIRAGLIG
jgi:hypothetical protein